MGCGSPPLIFGAWGYVDDVTPHLAWQHLPDIYISLTSPITPRESGTPGVKSRFCPKIQDRTVNA